MIAEAEKKIDNQGERVIEKTHGSPDALTQFANARRVIIPYFLHFIPPSHLHIHIYAVAPMVRARAGTFNASIKQRVTPTNNSIKLRLEAVGRLVEDSRANAITFIRRLP